MDFSGRICDFFSFKIIGNGDGGIGFDGSGGGRFQFDDLQGRSRIAADFLP